MYKWISVQNKRLDPRRASDIRDACSLSVGYDGWFAPLVYIQQAVEREIISIRNSVDSVV